MRTPMFFLRLWCCGLLLAWGVAGVFAATATRDGNLLAMQNDKVKLTIDLATGARVSEFIYKPFGQNIIYPVKDNGGLLLDHVTDQPWPGEFLGRMYNAEIVQAGPDQAVVRVWTDGQKETTKGFRFERLITLKDGDRALYCTLTIRNISDLGRMTSYWSQNCYWFGGKKEGITWSRACTRGIDRLGLDNNGDFWMNENWYFINDAIAGWTASYNKDLQQGMMLLMNYNDLQQLYDCCAAVTTEWMYDKVAIPAGKAWTTDITIIPVTGVSGFTCGTQHVVANFEVTPAPGGLNIEHQLAKSTIPLKDVTVRTKVWGLKKAWTATVPDAKFAELTDAAQKATVTATGVEAMPAGIQVTLTGTTPDGKQITETYGDYYGGAEGRNNDPFLMKPFLSFERPPKHKVFLKPDVIKYVPNAEPKVLYLRGLWTNMFRVDEALKSAFPQSTTTDGWLDAASGVGYNFSYFPGAYPDLLNRDLVILGNVPAAPMDLVGQEMLKDYLEAGGNVLILGGDQSYGQAGFSNESFINLIPVKIGGTFDWRKLPDGVLKPAGTSPVLDGVAFGPKDKVYYNHLLTPKPGATVAVTAGGKPILVLATTPQGGHIACVLATPFGEAGPGETAFWDSPAWAKLMANTVRWLVKH